jgi:hypothetical protein
MPRARDIKVVEFWDDAPTSPEGAREVLTLIARLVADRVARRVVEKEEAHEKHSDHTLSDLQRR